jgi:phospholipid/cholesterol/gamma-HCH transport system permease protein
MVRSTLKCWEDGAKPMVALLQDYVLCQAESFQRLCSRPYYVRDVIEQLDRIGVGSVPVIFGPVFTGLVMASRVGAGIAAELGSMMVTDQINAA